MTAADWRTRGDRRIRCRRPTCEPPARDGASRPGGTTSVSYIHLADGRWLAAGVPIAYGHTRLVFHVVLTLLAVLIGVAAYPHRATDQPPTGTPAARGGIAGRRRSYGARRRWKAATRSRDWPRASTAPPLRSSSWCKATRRCWRTPRTSCERRLARIRLAVELLNELRRRRAQAGDWSRTSPSSIGWWMRSCSPAGSKPSRKRWLSEELDLLALAAEECARYDDVQLEGAVVSVRGDARLLRRLLRNLLENARRHGAPPTHVRIDRESEAAVVTVWDSGPGVPPAEFENVFRPFYRPEAGGQVRGHRPGSRAGAADRAAPPR